MAPKIENPLFEYMSDVTINEGNLDFEWLRQQQICADWGVLYSQELKKKDLIWLRKKILKAQIFKRAKQTLDAKGNPLTDKAAENEVHADPEYEKVSKELIEAEERVNQLDTIKWAVIGRENSLREVTRQNEKIYGAKDHYVSEERGKQNREDVSERQRKLSEETDRMGREALREKGSIKIKR